MTLPLPLGAVLIAEGFQPWVVVVSCGVDFVGDAGERRLVGLRHVEEAGLLVLIHDQLGRWAIRLAPTVASVIMLGRADQSRPKPDGPGDAVRERRLTMGDSEAPGREERAHLLRFNIEKIEQGYLQAVAAGEERPVILVIDLRDKMGFDLASRLDPQQAEQVRDDCNRRGVIPTALLATSLPTAIKVIGFMTETGRETLQRPLPDGKFWVVGISAGGNSYGMLSIPDAPAEP